MIVAQMMFGPYYDHGNFWWVGGLIGLLIVIAIVVGVILVVRQFLERPPTRYAPPPPAPLSRAVEELDLRYARGEIDRTEYLQRRSDLMHGPLHAGPGAPGGPAAPPAPPPGASPTA